MILDNCLIYVSNVDDMDDVPLATRLKKRRVEKTGEKSRHAEEINHSEEINLGSSMRRAGKRKTTNTSIRHPALPYQACR